MTVPYTIPWERDIHTKVHVSRADGFTWVDLLPFVMQIETSSGNVTRFGGKIAGIDGVMPQLDLVLKQDFENRLNSQEQNSNWNIFNGQYDPLLTPMREISIATAVTSPGEQPNSSDWIGLFHGYLGDGIRVEEDTIRINCRSLSKRLQETYIENPKDYGSEEGIPLEDVIQDVLDDNLGIGEIELYCPEPTGFMVETYAAENVQYKTVWDVIQALATAHDFFLGDLWDPNTERMRLTLLVPPRDKDVNTADFVLNYRSDFYREEREIKDSAVRNVIIGHYWDKEVNEKRKITVKDDVSIRAFGRRAMEVEEAITSLIQTEEEMTDFLNSILADLKDQQGTTYLGMPFFPQITLFSGLVIHNPDMSSTNDFMGVESYRHTLDFSDKQFRTEIVGSGRIRGGQQKWLKSETRPGSPGNPNSPPTSNVPPANVAWGYCSFITDVSLTWEPVRGATAYEIRTDNNWGYSDGIIYRGNGLSFRFAPTQRSYTLYIKAINAAGLFSEQATEINLSLPVPEAPDQPQVDSYFTALQIHVTPLNSPAIMGYYIYLTKDGESESVKTLIQAGEHLTYSASSDTTFSVQVSAFDVLGEGAKSEPLQATTTSIDIDIDDELIENSPLVQSLDTRLTYAEGELVDQGSQIETLSDEITLKVQKRTSDGKYVVTGIGAAIGDDGQSEVAILADVFRMHTSVDGEPQTIFVVDGPSGKMYLLGDLIADGTIKARQMDSEAVKTWMIQAGVAYLDEANVLHLKADRISVGGSSPQPSGIVTYKPSNADLWHFDNSLQSTQGLKPSQSSATLVPDGGKFGGGVVVQSSLRYDTDVGSEYTVAVYKETATWQDYANMTWTELDAM